MKAPTSPIPAGGNFGCPPSVYWFNPRWFNPDILCGLFIQFWKGQIHSGIWINRSKSIAKSIFKPDVECFYYLWIIYGLSMVSMVNIWIIYG